MKKVYRVHFYSKYGEELSELVFANSPEEAKDFIQSDSDVNWYGRSVRFAEREKIREAT